MGLTDFFNVLKWCKDIYFYLYIIPNRLPGIAFDRKSLAACTYVTHPQCGAESNLKHKVKFFIYMKWKQNLTAIWIKKMIRYARKNNFLSPCNAKAEFLEKLRQWLKFGLVFELRTLAVRRNGVLVSGLSVSFSDQEPSLYTFPTANCHMCRENCP